MLCGRGADTPAYANLKFRHYIGIDPNKDDIQAAKNKWAESKNRQLATHLQLDPLTQDIYKKLKRDPTQSVQLFDVVFCQNRMLSSFLSPNKAAQFTDNVISIMAQDGIFAGYTLDPNALALLLQIHGKSLSPENLPLSLTLNNDPSLSGGNIASPQITLTFDLRERKNESLEVGSLKTDSAETVDSASRNVLTNPVSTPCYSVTVSYKNESMKTLSVTHALLSWEELSTVFNRPSIHGSLVLENTFNAYQYFSQHAFSMNFNHAKCKYFLDEDDQFFPATLELAKLFAIFIFRKKSR